MDKIIFLEFKIALTPKGRNANFSPFLKFGQAPVSPIFTWSSWGFHQTCGLLQASWENNFYHHRTYGLGFMKENKNLEEVRAGWACGFILELKILVATEQGWAVHRDNVCRAANPGYRVGSHSVWMSLQFKFRWWAAYCWKDLRLVAAVNNGRVMECIAQTCQRQPN
jgi:hypothetical protein